MSEDFYRFVGAQEEKASESEEERKNFEAESIIESFKEIVRPCELLRERGLQPFLPLQEFEGNEMTPENFLDIDKRALENQNCPNVVVNMPHAGEFVSKNLWERFTEDGKRSISKLDAGTAHIYRSPNVVNVASRIARFGLDLNRPPYSEKDTAGAKEAPGSLMWKDTMLATPMYVEGQSPTAQEQDAFSRTFHRKYWDTVLGMVDEIAARKGSRDGRMLVIDGHSFPTDSHNPEIVKVFEKYSAFAGETINLDTMPIFILSDRNGLSCDSDIKEALAAALRNNFDQYLTDDERRLLLEHTNPESIVMLEKYLPAGGYNADFFSKDKGFGINMLQIEVNESAYVNFRDGYNDADYDHGKMDIMQRLIEKSILDVDPLLKSKKIA